MNVLMPQLGETVTEGKIVRWFRTAGDVVKPGENLFEIETDKTSMEVPSTVAGTLTDIRFQVGAVARVGAVVAVIVGAEETAQPKATALIGAESVQADTYKQGRVSRPGGSERDVRETYPYPKMDPLHEVRTPNCNYGPARLTSGVFVTPLARRLAGERRIDLRHISGTGPHGRVVARDVEQAQPTSLTATALARDGAAQ